MKIRAPLGRSAALFLGLALASAVPATAFAAFGYTDNGTAYVVDSGAGLVFQVSKTDGTITSIVFNGTEYIGPSGKGSHIASGLGSPTTVTPETDGSTYVKITLQTDPTNGVVSDLTHYLIVRNGENRIYMATYDTAEPNVGELRWITRLAYDLVPNGPVPSDNSGNTGAIESTDVFGHADGTTTSKYYGDHVTHGKERAMDLTYCGATGPGIGAWMVFGNRESSSGGPFFRDIENQSGAGGDQEVYNYMNSGHNQTEPDRVNVLQGPYVLVFTTGAPPTLPIDFSWMGSLGLAGWVPASGRGSVSGTATGIPAAFQGVVALANSAAQYWAVINPADGSYTVSGVKPGTYTATLYKGELSVATASVTVNAGATTPLDLASTEPAPSVIFRIGDWDGTPAGLLNADHITQMHPQDVRNASWGPVTYHVGVDSPASFPAIQFRGANTPTTIKFTLAPNQITSLTLRIGITCAYNSGRPQIGVNNVFTSSVPAASSQPSSRSFTIGTYRGNNALFTYTIPASALVAGTNTMTITPASGSTDLGPWLSAGWVYDSVELDGPIAAPTITYVGGSPLIVSGTSEPSRNIALALDGSTPAGNAVASASGAWSITFSGSLSIGAHSFTAVASDDSGHSGPASAPFTVNTAVATPAIVSAVGDTGTYSNGATTSDRVFSFNGSAGPGDTVTLTRLGVGSIGTTTADGSGNWAFDYTTVSLPDGANSFYATGSNAAGTGPSSPVFTLNLAGQPRIAITRETPPFEVIPNTIASIVYRVAFNHSVNGVTPGGFALTATDTAAGTISSVSASSGTNFDVTVTNLSGTGTLRLDLAPNSGVTNSGGDPEAGYTAGQHYTLVAPTTGSGTWIQPAAGGNWSDAINWAGAVIADGDTHSADFSTLDLTADNTVHLDSPRTLNSLIFGDTNTATSASWILDGSALTLAGTTPTITVNALGDGAAVTLAAPLAGTAGLAKAGDGTLVLTAANPLTGPLAVNRGVVRLAPGSSLALGNAAISLALSTQLDIAGGSFATDGTVTTGSSTLIVDSGSASLGAFTSNADFGATLRVNGGMLAVGDVNIPRNSGASADFGSGFIVTGTGVATATTIELGTKNSTGAMSIEGDGSLTVSGPITIANQATGGRGGAMRVLDGTFTSTDTATGILMCRNNGSNANNVASATFTGGVSAVEKFTLGFDPTVTAGSATITLNGGALYLGAGGIVKNGASGLATNLNFSSGTLGAKSAWSTALPVNLPSGGNVIVRAADALGQPFDITLNGVIGGAGGFTKAGGGMLTLAAANTFTGSVALNAGTLNVTGSLAAGGTVTIGGTGTLAASGTIAKPVVLDGTLAPAAATVSAPSLTWNGGGTVSLALGASGVSGRLALSGALTKGAAGSYTFAFSPGSGFAAGNTYTIATFGSTNFTAADFSATGLPAGYVAIFSLDASGLTVTVKAIATVTLGDLTQAYDGTPRAVSATTDPAGLSVAITYDGSPTAPTLPGSYAVVATINDPAYAGSASGTLVITVTALIRHAPTLNGDIDGSAQILLGENTTLNGGAGVSGDLLVPGTPTVQLNGAPTYAGTIDSNGDSSPSNYTVTLNSHTLLRHVVRRVDPLALPTVDAPPVPTGTRNVTLNSPNQSPGNFATLRNLTLNSDVGQVAVPTGTYGTFTANSGSGFTLGIAGATEPAVYHLQGLTLNSGATVQIVGPVILTLANGATLNHATVGAADHAEWLTLRIASGGLTLNSSATLHGVVLAPAGTVMLNSGTLHGRVSSERLTINGGAVLEDQP
ncbi:MAG TPA: rhamnogalacturonan lyase B N-terminal domain-containing protein [Opitutus sp.]|nr:rhamnogalacturonan lyase B N-terminal domain-containing protein [Opitutus sp.]